MGQLIVDNMPYTFLYIRAIYNGTTFWLPLLLLSMVSFPALWSKFTLQNENSEAEAKYSRRFLWKILGSYRLRMFVVFLAVCLLGVRVYATHFEPHNLKVKRIVIEGSGVDEPVRIVHISDIQSMAIGTYEERVFQLIRQENPDLLIHTGDLLQPYGRKPLETEVRNIARLMETVDAPLGKFAVFGDTDSAMHGRPAKSLGGLTFLESEQVMVKKGGTRINVFALAYREAQFGPEEKVAAWVDSASPEDFTLLIGHSPDYVLEVSKYPIDLCLAGHTHGGQIRLPFIGPLVTCSRIPRKLARGFHQVDETWLNTSAGIGCERCFRVPKIRFLCPSEFTVIDLVPVPSV